MVETQVFHRILLRLKDLRFKAKQTRKTSYRLQISLVY